MFFASALNYGDRTAVTALYPLLQHDFHLSDLGLAAARELDVPMPVAAVTAQLVQASVGSGRVDEDFAILLDLQAAASGIELKPENVEVDDGLGAADESEEG